MNQADKDAQKWMEANSKWQYNNLIKAKETGTPHYIDKNGIVVTPKEKEKS